MGSWLLQMVLETKAGLESGIIGAGHRVAASRLDAQRSTAGWVSEQMGGLSYLTFIRQLLPRVESDWDSVKVGDEFAVALRFLSAWPDLYMSAPLASCSTGCAAKSAAMPSDILAS